MKAVLLGWIRSSLVVRTTFAVLLAVLLVGLVADMATQPLAKRIALQRQQQSMEAIMDVAEPSASAACFAHDEVLAKQVTHGLVAARLVHSARLMAEGRELAHSIRESAVGGLSPISRTLKSPFEEGLVVGELSLLPDPEETQRQVQQFVRLFRMTLAALTLAMGITLVLVVNRFITRPIRRLSKRLHQLEATTGERLNFPGGHEGDEIGQLVLDVNTLVERLVLVLEEERGLVRKVAREHEKLAVLLKVAGTGILVLDGEGRLENWNPASERLLGLETAPPPAGAPLSVLFGLAGPRVDELLKQCRNEQSHQEVTLPIELLGGGGTRWVQLSLDPIGTEGLLCLIGDVTTHQRATEEAQELAVRDVLTGALNRLGVTRLLQARLAADHQGLALFLVDLDHFKQVNDTFGHEAGDEVLKTATKRMVRGLRCMDHVARLGGDEFLILGEGILQPETALNLGYKLVDALRKPIPLGPLGEAHIGASIGIAIVPSGSHPDPEEVLRQADSAMYRVKEAGRNGAALWQN